MAVSSHEDSADEFCCAESIFSMKLSGFMRKAIKLLLTESVGQCRKILILAFSALIQEWPQAIYSCFGLPVS